jgi:hypothetical protein
VSKLPYEPLTIRELTGAERERAAAIFAARGKERFFALDMELMKTEPTHTPSRPMCFSCGLEVPSAVIINFSHAPRWPEAKHDSLVVLCPVCVSAARAVLNGGKEGDTQK